MELGTRGAMDETQLDDEVIVTKEASFGVDRLLSHLEGSASDEQIPGCDSTALAVVGDRTSEKSDLIEYVQPGARSKLMIESGSSMPWGPSNC